MGTAKAPTNPLGLGLLLLWLLVRLWLMCLRLLVWLWLE